MPVSADSRMQLGLVYILCRQGSQSLSSWTMDNGHELVTVTTLLKNKDNDFDFQI